MIGRTNKAILQNKLQRRLRHTMTDAERLLWQALRGGQMAGHKFRRQHPFDDFILDFVCLERKLVVEVDGGNMANRRMLMPPERIDWLKQDSVYYAFGTMRYLWSLGLLKKGFGWSCRKV